MVSESTLLVAIVIIPIGDRFVVVQEAKDSCRGKWSLPGGEVEKNENLIDAAIREAREEAGLKIAPRGILAMEHLVYADSTKSLHRQKVRFVIVADALTQDLKKTANGESLCAKLCTRDEINKLEMRGSNYKKWLDAYAKSAPLLSFDNYHFAPQA